MAQIDSNAQNAAGHGAPGAVATVTTWAGAAMSAVLVGGVIVWGWQLTMRDVTGIPVIRAMDSPMRVAPESAGGARAAYQGLAVNQVAENEIPELPQRLVLAPGALELAAEDMPAVSETAPAEPEVSEAPAREAETPGPALAGTDLAVAEALGMTPDAMVVRASLQVEPEVERTRPAPRPAATSRIRVEPSAESVRELDPGALEPGTRLVQLGAFDSAEAAREAWRGLASEFEGYLDGKQRVVQQAQTGEDPFFRLRAAGFEDLADARRFCSALVARNAECIPARVR